jgi:epoxyqueuosine reductase
MNLIDKAILKFIQHKVCHWFNLERSLTKVPKSCRATEGSPEKTWPDPEKIPLGGEVPFSVRNIFIVGMHLKSSIREGVKAIQSLDENPSEPRSTISPEVLEAFESHAKSLGIGAIGYARLPHQLIFKDRAVLYDNVIVLLKEMDKDKIAKAPSVATFKMVFETYDALGKIVNALTGYLRKLGYGAQGGHPLGGLTLYPPLASAAGLGWMGRHGLLITPEFGPRQRIGAIFTSISNLPFTEGNAHSWIQDFCSKCGRCIRACPSKAICEQPVIHESGRRTHIVREKCLPIFVTQEGCTICVKECSFSRRSYEDIRQSLMSTHGSKPSANHETKADQ